MAKRCCIVGTFNTWKQTPWSDPTLEIWSLNDAYVLGLPRADRWFEIHPLDRMWFRDKAQKVINPKEIPEGFYVRPKGHLEWLKGQAKTIPVILQNAPPADWPANARRFPIEDVEAKFGADYWASGPAYMLALAMMEGYTEIWITGIHLATAHEYREQRPQLEHLLGRALGPDVTVETKDGWRRHVGAVTIVLPQSCPLLTHGWRYAYDPKPVAPVDPWEAERKAVLKEKQELLAALTRGAVRHDREKLQDRLTRLEIIELDIHQQTMKSRAGGTLTAQFAAA